MSRRRSRKKNKKQEATKTTNPLEGLTGRLSRSPLPTVLLFAVLFTGAVYGLERMRAHVYAQPAFDPQVRIELADVPGQEWLDQENWRPRIRSAIPLPEDLQWNDPKLVDRVARRVASSGWVSEVKQVAKLMDGRVRIVCDYRRPIAMVYTRNALRDEGLSDGYFPVDAAGVRLPETYGRIEADSGWLRIFGVQTPPPPVGEAYPEKSDAKAAVRVAERIFQQDYAWKISVIDVNNYQGRQDRQKDHIFLLPRMGEPITWGSAIGEECFECSVEDKLHNLGLLLEQGYPQVRTQIHIDRLGWRELHIPVVQTADTSAGR